MNKEIKHDDASLNIEINMDPDVVRDFGKEWTSFKQDGLSEHERRYQFNSYFDIFPWDKISQNSIGFDAGCGTGRWAVLIAPMVKKLYCIEPSLAIDIAKKNLLPFSNCSFCQCAISNMPFPDESMDFGYSLGVLHHIPDTYKGLKDCVRKLKSGAPFLIYVYYAFDNQPVWYRVLWKISDFVRRGVSHAPYAIKLFISFIIAIVIYFPLARSSLLFEKIGGSVHSWPLSAYRKRSLYSMRTDALDRFGTKLENRYTKDEIINMMKNAGLENIVLSNHAPFYCAVGTKI